MNFFAYVLYGCYALFILIRQVFNIRHQFHTRQTPKQNSEVYESKLSRSARNIALNLLILTVIIHVFNPPWFGVTNHAMPAFLRIIGTILAACGLILLMWTHYHLGKQWSADLELQHEHELITSGPYQYIRHPMYTALYSFFLGTALISGNYILEFLSIAIIVIIHFRIRQEEKMLGDEFGDSYKEYSNKTGLILPKFKN
jgi:protein-S-isoprenylcysteine O-methyltransferase Ste14